MTNNSYFVVVIMVCLNLLFTNCGQKGALYYPDTQEKINSENINIIENEGDSDEKSNDYSS